MSRFPAIIMAVAAITGCTVIKEDLLGPSDARIDAKPGEAAIDAPSDAYVPFAGNLASNPDLENNSTQGWSTNGGSAVVAVSTAQAHAGTHSLLTNTRQGKWNGPAITLTATIRPGKMYSASAWVRLMATGTDKVAISTKHMCIESAGTEMFNSQTNRVLANATETAWVQPTSTFTVASSATCTLSLFQVYVESEAILDAFYVDDIEIREMQ